MLYLVGKPVILVFCWFLLPNLVYCRSLLLSCSISQQRILNDARRNTYIYTRKDDDVRDSKDKYLRLFCLWCMSRSQTPQHADNGHSCSNQQEVVNPQTEWALNLRKTRGPCREVRCHHMQTCQMKTPSSLILQCCSFIKH